MFSISEYLNMFLFIKEIKCKVEKSDLFDDNASLVFFVFSYVFCHISSTE